MTRKLTRLSRRYVVALRKYLKQERRASLQPSRKLGHQAVTFGMETLDLARIHEQALIALVLPCYTPSIRDVMIQRAGIFFAEAITPIEKRHRTAREANVQLNQMVERLNRRSVALAVSNRELKREIAQRK